MEVFLGTRLHSVWRTEFQNYLEYFIYDCYVSALEEWLEKKLNMVKVKIFNELNWFSTAILENTTVFGFLSFILSILTPTLLHGS